LIKWEEAGDDVRNGVKMLSVKWNERRFRGALKEDLRVSWVVEGGESGFRNGCLRRSFRHRR